MQTFWLTGTTGQLTIQPKTPENRPRALQIFQADQIHNDLQKNSNITINEVNERS